TDFVRHNMLEQPETEKQLLELERNYDDLHRLHDAVVAARQKIQLLEPVSQLGEDAKKAAQEREVYHCARTFLDPWMSGKAIVLYRSRLERQRQELAKQVIDINNLDNRQAAVQQQIEQIRDEISGNGGSRLQQLTQEIKQKEVERDDRHKNYALYQGLALALELDSQLESSTFVSNIEQAKNRAESIYRKLIHHEERRD
ncbi:TPA: hypothetical protein ACX3IL_005664, partial [Klebsiella pneumoniae]